MGRREEGRKEERKEERKKGRKEGRKRERGGREEGRKEGRKEGILYIDLLPFTKNNAKWIINLNVQCKTIKLLEYNIEENLGSRFGNQFLDNNTKSMIHERKNKSNFI